MVSVQSVPRECKMRIERIGGSHLDTDSEVSGFDQTTWELVWAGEVAMRKRIPALRQAGYESISDLPRIQKSYRENDGDSGEMVYSRETISVD